jgi:hypothetical protein
VNETTAAPKRPERGLGRHATRGQPRDVFSGVATMRADFSRTRRRRILKQSARMNNFSDPVFRWVRVARRKRKSREEIGVGYWKPTSAPITRDHHMQNIKTKENDPARTGTGSNHKLPER